MITTFYSLDCTNILWQSLISNSRIISEFMATLYSLSYILIAIRS